MQYSPKLKKAMEEINRILDRYDIAGIVVLHTPGFGEYKFKIDPSYSCAELMPGGHGVKVSNTGRGQKEKKKMAEDTANMFHILGTLTGEQAMKVFQANEALKEKLDIRHYGPGHSSRDEQEN